MVNPTRNRSRDIRVTHVGTQDMPVPRRVPPVPSVGHTPPTDPQGTPTEARVAPARSAGPARPGAPRRHPRPATPRRRTAHDQESLTRLPPATTEQGAAPVRTRRTATGSQKDGRLRAGQDQNGTRRSPRAAATGRSRGQVASQTAGVDRRRPAGTARPASGSRPRRAATGTARSRRLHLPELLRAHAGRLASSPAALVGLFALALVLCTWTGLAWASSTTVASGTTVSGVDLSGLDRSQAAARLDSALADRLTQPLTVTAAGGSATIDPSAVDLAVDTDATLDPLTGFTLNPVTIAHRLSRPTSSAVTTVDTHALTVALQDALPELSTGTASATVSLDGTRIVRTEATAGEGMDLAASVARLSSAWPLTGSATVALPEGTAEPLITEAEASTFIEDTLTPLLSGDVTLTHGATTLTLTPTDLASMATITTDDGELGVSLDASTLRQRALDTFGADLETAGTDATWTIAGSDDATPELVHAVPGTAVDGQVLSAAIVKAGSRGGSRTTELTLTDVDPAVTDAVAQGWGVNEVVGEFSTDYRPDPARDANLVQGCARVNNHLVMPGGTFSVTDALGTVDAENGFTDAGVIVAEQHVDAMGGGLSQVGTTVFNAGFEAGMDDVEHTPHSQYMSRYPEGREATIWTGQKDVKFTNSTPYAVLVQAWVSGDQVHVRLWSTTYYTVDIETSARTNVVDYSTTTTTGATCVPNEEGEPGFDVTVTRRRTVVDTGKALPTETLQVHYNPNNVVVCG